MPHRSKSPPDTTHTTPVSVTADPIMLDVTDDLAGQRLDRALAAALPSLSRTRAQAAITAGRVTVDGRPAKSSLLLESGMRVVVAPPLDAATPPQARTDQITRTEPLHIIYEDAHLLIVDKPAGVVVHPAPGHPDGTLVDALLAHLPDLDTTGDPTRPGIVHRLDKDTSGLLVIAKDAPTHTALAEQMKERRMVKRYLALVEGQMSLQEGVIEAPIGRDPRHRQRMGVVTLAAGGREARTRFHVLRSHRGRSLLELQLETGRTHQIRVHLAAVHHPVVGDSIYGRPQPPLPPRQFLHAAHLEFAHPITGAWLTFDAPLPPDLAGFLAKWER
ncbi:MAG TPA: RluA family pseudouridine synthase [Ktedonobacterales bacterium]|nr:RluA family pseudouridine synthase [Ktedonobacterales bacterium]